MKNDRDNTTIPASLDNDTKLATRFVPKIIIGLWGASAVLMLVILCLFSLEPFQSSILLFAWALLLMLLVGLYVYEAGFNFIFPNEKLPATFVQMREHRAAFLPLLVWLFLLLPTFFWSALIAPMGSLSLFIQFHFLILSMHGLLSIHAYVHEIRWPKWVEILARTWVLIHALIVITTAFNLTFALVETIAEQQAVTRRGGVTLLYVVLSYLLALWGTFFALMYPQHPLFDHWMSVTKTPLYQRGYYFLHRRTP